MDRPGVIETTRRWIADMVIGLNLCPFAGRVFHDEKIRYVVTEATDESTLQDELERELTSIARTPRSQVETTLLIHPHVLGDFFAYVDFLAVAEEQLRRLGLRGVIQIASFHPEYQFAGTPPDAVENYTSRSPYPMLHLLREESITAVADDPDELREIPKRNGATLRQLGRTQILERLDAIRRGNSAEG